MLINRERPFEAHGARAIGAADEGNSNMAVNLDKFSLKELLELEEKLEKAVGVARERDRAEVRAKLEAIAQQSGFAISELYGARTSRKVASGARYANPDNRSETWTGRGRKPNWLVARLAKGAKLEDFALR